MTELAECLQKGFNTEIMPNFMQYNKRPFDLMLNFVSLAEIWLNHMTESAECLPKGIRVERSDFD